MEINEIFYLSKLKSELASRQKLNSHYSLRAFAKDLGIDSSNLSAVLKKKRNLPPHRAQKISESLNLGPTESALFINSTLRKKMNLDDIEVKEESKKYILDEIYYQVISQWEYFAFLQLLKLDDFKSDINWISKKLGISNLRSEVVIDDLIKLKFIKKNSKGIFKRITSSIETSEDVESKALQKSHEETLNLAKDKLIQVDVNKRDYSSITISVDPAKLPEAKALVREFQEKLYTLMSKGPQKEVYVFSSQLFPVTKDNL